MPRPWNTHLKAWKDRLSALKNLPPVLALLWQSGRGTVAAGIGFRLVGALLPLAGLWVGKLIIDLIVGAIMNPGPVPPRIWLLLAAEFAIAALGAILGRATDYYDGRLADQFAREVIYRNQRLAKRRLRMGALLAVVGSLGYYGAYAFLVFRTLRGALTVGDLTFLAGALAGCSSQIQSVFSTFTGIADQALFLSDLLEFFSVKPKISNAERALPAPRPIREGFEFRGVSFAY